MLAGCRYTGGIQERVEEPSLHCSTGQEPQWFLYLNERERRGKEKDKGGIGWDGCENLVKKEVNGKGARHLSSA